MTQIVRETIPPPTFDLEIEEKNIGPLFRMGVGGITVLLYFR
jgi:hypothetical protein